MAWFLLRVIRRLSAGEAAVSALVVAGLAAALFESWFFGIGEGFAVVFWLSTIIVANSAQRVRESGTKTSIARLESGGSVRIQPSRASKPK
jgi:hypothetical protein